MRDERVDLRDRTKAFALRVIKLFGALPRQTVAQVLGKQLLRSGTSVGATYREAYRAREVDHCTIYVGLFGNDYGFEDKEGVSPTEREFDRATLRANPGSFS